MILVVRDAWFASLKLIFVMFKKQNQMIKVIDDAKTGHKVCNFAYKLRSTYFSI